jgi:hypothetical protein
LFAIWLGFRGYVVWHELRAAKAQIAAVEQELVTDSAPPELRAQLEGIARHTAAAHGAAHDPVWHAISEIPYLGNNLQAVTTLADASDAVGRGALPALERAASDLTAARGGKPGAGFPLAPVQAASADLGEATNRIELATRAVQSAPESLLLPSVRSARNDLLGRLGALEHRIRPIADTAHLLPAALGSAGPRTYFVAFVNPSEARGGGGLFGAYALVRAQAGKLTVAKIGSNSDLPNLENAPTSLDPDFDARYARYGAETDWTVSNLSPHFPYTGDLWAQMYSSLTGTQPDGVVSLDPEALAALLRNAGPVNVSPGLRITASSVVSFIERDEYRLALTPAQRKDVLKSVARAAVQHLLSEPAGLGTDMLRALGTSAAGGHILFMSTHADEQHIIATYPVAGVVPETSRPFASLFINNAGSGKLDAYLDTALTYAVTGCSVQHRAVDVTVVLRNGAPSSGLPAYVADARSDDVSYGAAKPVPGQNRSLLAVMLTAGAQLRSATLNGQPIGTSPGPGGSSAPYLQMSTERGHPVVSMFVDLKSKATATLALSISEPPSTERPLLVRQPMPQPQALKSTGSCSGS